MIRMLSVTEVYAEIDKLVLALEAEGEKHFSLMLKHRLHSVAWTSGSELLEEIQAIFKEMLASSTSHLPEERKQNVARLLKSIDSYV